MWANTVVWGNGYLDVGADWSGVGPTTVIWGNLNP
jgi:hypothetical protein